MLEYHAWLVVLPSPSHGDDRESVRDEQRAGELARVEVGRLEPGRALADVRTVNGTVQIHLAGFSNHRSPDVLDAIDVFERVARAQPGSYGMFHVYDDEDPRHDNEFQVLIARRGRVVHETDPFLSPIVPTVEDGAAPARRRGLRVLRLLARPAVGYLLGFALSLGLEVASLVILAYVGLSVALLLILNALVWAGVRALAARRVSTVACGVFAGISTTLVLSAAVWASSSF